MNKSISENKSSNKKIALKSVILFAVGGFFVIGLAYWVWSNTQRFKEETIKRTQQHLLAIARLESQKIQEFFNNILIEAKAVAKEPIIIGKVKEGTPTEVKTKSDYYPDKKFFDHNVCKADSTCWLNGKGIVLGKIPFDEGFIGKDYSGIPDVKFVLENHAPYFSKPFKMDSGISTISICYPIFEKDNFLGITRALVSLDTINNLVSTIEVGERGYAWIISEQGTMMAHPKREHRGIDIMAIRRKTFPDFDWFELEDIVKRMKNGEEGLGVYHSAWWTEDKLKIVEKLTAFSPIKIEISEELWSIGVSLSYDEIEGPIVRNAVRNYVGAGILLLVFSIVGISIYKTQKKKAEMEIIFKTAKELKVLNEELQIEISNREKIEIEVKIKNTFLQLHKIAAVSANEAKEIEDAFIPILKAVCSYSGWPLGHAYIISRNDPNLLEPTTLWNIKENRNFSKFCDITKATKFPKGRGLPGRVMASSKPHWIKDVAKDPDFPRADAAKSVGIKSGFAFPVMVEKEVVAVLEFFNTEIIDPDYRFLEVMDNIGKELGRVVERKQAEKLIKSSRDYLQKLNDSLGAVIFTVKIPERVVEYVNCTVESVFGYKPDECIGKKTKIFYPAIEEYHDFGRSLERAIKEGKNELKQERLFKRKNGEKFPCEVTTTFLRENEIIVRVISILHDITESKKMEEELSKIQKLESLGILAGGIAHDFNNNLQAILSNLNLAMMGINPKDEIYGRLKESVKAVLQAKHLSQQLLTFSKGGEPIKKTISISELIKGSINFALSGSNIASRYDILEDLRSVEADEGQINQVISNLLLNANQAMPEGGDINVKAENVNVESEDILPLQDGKYIKITIEDHGAGIPEEHRQKIFDPFFTTKEAGNGLGLATTYSIIKKHGGHITVESKLGVGTTFYIYLPASEKEISVETALSETEVKHVKEDIHLQGKKLLLMDDELIIAKSVSQQLKDLEYEVEIAKNGDETIGLYKRAMESGRPFDAVVMDLTIPGGIGGKDAIKELLKIDPDVKAVIASGYSNDPVMANFSEYGFSGVIAKPYEICELNETLHKALKGIE